MGMDPENVDLIIIGAGLYGIQASRTYLEVHPHSSIVIFEGSSSIGGVWSKDRVYDAFWTQTPIGMAEFSDKRLPSVPESESYYGFFPARYVTQYLKSYVESHVYAGSPLASRVRLNSCVTSLRKDAETELWRACVSVQSQLKFDGAPERSYTVIAPKVIDATGLTSSPHVPRIPSLDAFTGESMHQKDVAQSDFLTKDTQRNVVVIGGAKSAADMAYAAAKAGKCVTWLIRKSGSGPASLALAQGSGPYKNSNESFYTRLTALFLASIFTGAGSPGWSFAGYVERTLYRTSIGMVVFSWIWKRITARAWKEADYESRQPSQQRENHKDKSPGGGKGFCNLQPDTDIFWQNDSSGINQRPDFFSTIADKVTVYREDIERISDRAVILADTERTPIPTDVIIFATGWDTKTSYTHLDDATACSLGLPVPKSLQSAQYSSKWSDLDSTAEVRVLRRFPVLAHPPPHHSTPTSLTPFRLYRGMLPPSDHSIIFIGKVMLGNHFRTAEVQALWALAVFEGTLGLPSEEAMDRDIADTVAWCRKRYLGKGQLGNWFWFDMVPYTDTLLEQLGLGSHREQKGWRALGDWWRPCFARDLRGLIQEYTGKYHQSGDTSVTPT
ncbi:putative dimethylaniline monooxygenase [Lentithecium fluviatile CBS 122367]|uniref:Putative dimethylaniline monooxygenase n=1 Tax=Lentithecium fluviatile CBS 122367 TaxID=1168545 RepID=A0A6G1IKF7_9PLEO|nr:putative dimethylaniline monooxygenase [Lentithecium fluviatile CBS 122367]